MALDNPFTSSDAGGLFRDSFRFASKQGGFITVSRTGAGFAEKPVPAGTHFIWNVLNMQSGFVRMVKGRYARRVAPHGQPEPQLPAGEDANDWQAITVTMVWLAATENNKAGIFELGITGKIALNGFANLYKLLSYKQEIQTGKLPVLEIHPSYDVETAYGTFSAPVCEVVGFIDYDVDTFGQPICRPPSPMLAGTVPAPQIASANDETPVATSVATPEVKPANDPLARFRPAAAGKKPY